MDKKELNKGYRYVDTDSVLEEDSELFLKALESIQKTGCAYPSVMKSEMYPIKPVTYLTVLDIMRFTDDAQGVVIFERIHNSDYAIYEGKMQEIPPKLFDLKVTSFFSGYMPEYNDFRGSFIGIRVVKN